jgi:ATP-dependent helicase HrpB
LSDELPIHQVLPELASALASSGSAVLIAPPGAGKTTAVAPALLGEAWCSGQILLTSPRRVAARAAAERMAELLGEKAGETIGYATRLDSKIGPRTRIIVMTEAIFVNRILDDPELPGVSAVLFDEVHERHLDCDLGLALALESKAVVREDLRLVAMSATLDGARFAALFGPNAGLIESEGKSFPLEIRYLGSSGTSPSEQQMVSAIMTAWREQQGDILGFLPGVREIERVRDQLTDRLPDVPVLPLHGQVEPPAQRAAIKRDPEGRRRIVLATSIAETSLTLDGVSVVVDSGLARLAEYDPAAGMTCLVTRAASQAAATQRAGRAARQSPGVAYRLWEEHGHAGRPAYSPPEITNADLSDLVLALAAWGTLDPTSLPWLDEPPKAAIASARDRLRKVGALDYDGRLTPKGEQISALPLDPFGAAAVLAGAAHGQELAAAKLVLLLQERGLGGRSDDLLQRLQWWDGDRGRRAESARNLAQRWAGQARKLVPAQASPIDNPAVFLVIAKPDMVARRRDGSGENWLSAGGRGYSLDPASPLARAEWIVIGEAQGRASGARIFSGAELRLSDVEEYLEPLIMRDRQYRWNKVENRVEPRLERRLGAITIARGQDPSPDPDEIVDILVDKAGERLGEMLPDDLLARGLFIGISALSEGELRDSVDLWLRPLLEGRRDLGLSPSKLAEAVLNQLSWEDRQALDTMAPRYFTSLAQTRHAIDYAGDDAPSVEVRVQALFGLDQHPMIGRTPLLLKLTSPAGRPIQSTRDLPGFWRGSWADVAKDMKGRYPKHRWPEQPWREKPSLKTKNAFNRE